MKKPTKTRGKRPAAVADIAKMIAGMVQDGMKGLEKAEQERRVKAFCEAAAGQRRTPSRASGSSGRAPDRMAARGRA